MLNFIAGEGVFVSTPPETVIKGFHLHFYFVLKMLNDNQTSIPVATAVPVTAAQAQSHYVAQPATPVQSQPSNPNQQVVYAVPVHPPAARVVIQEQRPVQVVYTTERYCGPITLFFGLLLAFFIGPFALLVVFCPVDEKPPKRVYKY